MDDVAIFDGGLSADQIMSIMDGDFSEFGGGGGTPFQIISVSKGETLVNKVLVPSVSITFTSRPGRMYKGRGLHQPESLRDTGRVGRT